MVNTILTTALGALVLFSPQTEQNFYAQIPTREVDTALISVQAETASTYLSYRPIVKHIEPVKVEPKEDKIEAKPVVVVQKQAVHKVEPILPPTELGSLVEKYASQYGARKDLMLIIMNCESGNNPNAVNGSFAGLYQFMASTWVSNRNAMGLDPNPNLRYNAEEAIRTAAFKMGRDGYGAWPACSNKAFKLVSI